MPLGPALVAHDVPAEVGKDIVEALVRISAASSQISICRDRNDQKLYKLMHICLGLAQRALWPSNARLIVSKHWSLHHLRKAKFTFWNSAVEMNWASDWAEERATVDCCLDGHEMAAQSPLSFKTTPEKDQLVSGSQTAEC